MAQRLYCRNENAPAPTFPAGTAKLLATSDATGSQQRRTGRWTSDLQGNSDTGQLLPFSADQVPPAVCTEARNTSGAITITEGWVWDTDLEGQTLPAGGTIPVRIRASNEYGTNTSGRLMLRLLVGHVSGGAWVLDANLLTTDIPGEVSHAAGQEGWASSTARVAIPSVSLDNYDFEIPGIAAPYTFGAGEYLYVQIGFSDADSTANRAWAIRYGAAQVYLDLPDFATIVELAGSVEAVATVAGTLERGRPYRTLAKLPGRTQYVVFKGTFTGGTNATVRWSNVSVKHPDRFYDGRMLTVPAYIASLPETVGGPPERVSFGLDLDNTDRSLGKYLIGTASGQAASEYTDDSFLNLRGQVYVGIKDDEDGACAEYLVSPTLYCAGEPTSKETQITVPMASRDDALLGQPAPMVTVRQLKYAAWVADGTKQFFDDTNETFDTGDLSDWQEKFLLDRMNEVIPYAYGRPVLDFIRTATDGNDNTGLLFVSVSEPTILNVEQWELFAGTYQTQIRGLDEEWSYLFKVKARFTMSDATTEDLWVVGMNLVPAMIERRGIGDGWRVKYLANMSPSDSIKALPGINSVLSNGTIGGRQTVSQIIRGIITDLSETGAAGIDADSFDRMIHGGIVEDLVGGVVKGEATIAEILQNITEPFGMYLWVGSDDKLHIISPGAWGADDVTAAATGLPHLKDSDILGEWQEYVPHSDNARGSAASRITFEWSREQEEFWGLDNLPRRTPGVTALALGQTLDARVRAGWLVPSRANFVARALSSRRAFVSRRFRFATHSWVATYSLTSLFRLSFTHGAGTGGAAGYVNRLVRLEAVELRPDADVCLATFEDLGPLEAIKPALWDDITNWVAYNPEGSGATLELAPGAVMNRVSASLAIFTGGAWVGRTLWTPGAATENNRRSVRVTAKVSDSILEVEYDWAATETLAAVAGSTAAADADWIFMDNQETNGAAYRPSYLRVCSEGTGLFRDGTTAGFQVMPP